MCRIVEHSQKVVSYGGMNHQHMATKKQEEAPKQVLSSAMIEYEKRTGFHGLGKFLEERGTIIIIPDEPE